MACCIYLKIYGKVININIIRSSYVYLPNNSGFDGIKVTHTIEPSFEVGKRDFFYFSSIISHIKDITSIGGLSLEFLKDLKNKFGKNILLYIIFPSIQVRSIRVRRKNIIFFLNIFN